MKFLKQVFVLFIAVVSAFPIGLAKNLPISNEVVKYLSDYGYITTSTQSANVLDGSAVTQGLQEFQSFMGLDVTGEMNDATLKMMAQPRCGVKDKTLNINSRRLRRYSLYGTFWPKKNLTYKITNYAYTLEPSKVHKAIASAFDMWSKVADLKFKESYDGETDLEISFHKGEHNDNSAFDGPGHTLAHAFYPTNGQIHFDDAEEWTIGAEGQNLLQVATHEIGHALGLEHSSIPTAVMAPIIYYKRHFKLEPDDIEGIQLIYGYNDDVEKINCRDLKIKAIFNAEYDEEKHIYVFTKDQYYSLDNHRIARGTPELIAKGWPGLPDNIDAAFTNPEDGRTYFFKGSKLWAFNGRRMITGYPQEISKHFSGLPDNLDAAMIGGFYRTPYFFKGDKFWYYEDGVLSTATDLSKLNKMLPSNLDAAWSDGNGFTYFIKGDTTYQFSDYTFNIKSSKTSTWFDCKA